MCACTPDIRTPWCGKPGCQRPTPTASPDSPVAIDYFSAPGRLPFPAPGPLVAAVTEYAAEQGTDVHTALAELVAEGLAVHAHRKKTVRIRGQWREPDGPAWDGPRCMRCGILHDPVLQACP